MGVWILNSRFCIMKIRLAKKWEEKKLSEIVKKNYSDLYAWLVRKEIWVAFKDLPIKPIYLVAEEKWEIKWFAGFSLSRMDYHIYNIFRVNVDPKYQNQGIGAQLIEKIIKTIKSYKGTFKAHMIMLTTTKPKFYEQFGFEKMMEYKKDDYLMNLKLAQ